MPWSSTAIPWKQPTSSYFPQNTPILLSSYCSTFIFCPPQIGRECFRDILCLVSAMAHKMTWKLFSICFSTVTISVYLTPASEYLVFSLNCPQWADSVIESHVRLLLSASVERFNASRIDFFKIPNGILML